MSNLEPDGQRASGGDGTGIRASRRGFLQAAGVAGLVATAGCTGGNNNGSTDTTTTRRTTAHTTTTTEETTTRFPEELPESGTINAVPADPDAEWKDAGVFQVLNGDIPYKLDLGEARGRHYDDLQHWSNTTWDGEHEPPLQKFADNILTNPEWRREILDQAAKEYGEDHLEDTFKPEEYKKDAPFDQRLKDSNFQAFWYPFEDVKFGSVSSTHNEAKASAIQALEQNAEKDTIVWGHLSINEGRIHGLVTALENPTYNEDEFDQQNTYIVETDPREDYQVMNLVEDGYPKGSHPAEKQTDHDRKEPLWLRMIGNTDSKGFHAEPDASYASVEKFAEFLRNPSTDSGQKYMDLMAATYDLAKDERLQGMDATVSISTDELSYS